MRKNDVRIGMKVVPHRKTVIGWMNLTRSHCWGNGGKEQGFLYVVGWDSEECCWTLSHIKGNRTGDFFNSGDFKPYERSSK